MWSNKTAAKSLSVGGREGGGEDSGNALKMLGSEPLCPITSIFL